MTGKWRIGRAHSAIDGMAGVPAGEFRSGHALRGCGATCRGSSVPTLHRSCWNSIAAVHIPGTDDGAALGHIRCGAVELIVRKFQSLLVSGKLRAALSRATCSLRSWRPTSCSLRMKTSFSDFEAVRLEVLGETPETAPLGSNVL